uniref:SUI1 domain-containing protein n=1 Tax=Ascaris lumbricoides TaxID=6252 RepID=A0A0M3IGF6_ASCLU
MAETSIQNLNKPKDAFEQLEDEEGTRQGFCHIRIQQRTGRKTITTVQGIAPEYDLKKIVRYLKKMIDLSRNE